MNQRLVLLGPPASGKGTQSARISAAFGIPATSTGAILRDELARATPRGLEAATHTRRGALVPDGLVMELVGDWIATRADRFLFDGFPRTVAQAEQLDLLLEQLGSRLDAVLLLDLAPEEIRRRMLGRLVCSVCGKLVNIGRHVASEAETCPQCGGVLARREDDNEEVLRRRLEVYEEKTAPLIPYYQVRGVLHRLDSAAGEEAVFACVSRVVEGGAI